MAKILVVDDEADLEVLIKQKFRQKIRENRYEFLFAGNGVQALEQLEGNADVDVVLSDINMPVMDGLTLLSKISEANLLVKAVVVSAYGDMENIRTAMNRGAFDFVTKPVNFQDLELTIDKTIEQVNHMRQTLKAIRENDILKMYVDESVLNFMAGKEYESSVSVSETIEGTVVFIDICGFTRISETESPDEVVKLLNKYFEVIVKEIISQGGHVDKFMGDAVMAVFRGNFHLDRAIDACLSVRNKISQLPPVVSFAPQVAMGINTGEMISGNIGAASLKRLDFTVIGDTVNVAQRLQSAAGPGQLLITKAAYDQVSQSFNCQFVAEINLKNKANPILVYEVLE
jgi:class 3 adenylate cyclase/AmiR/NasT family two-component response regulator